MCIDKDILVKGNKVYGPIYCVYVPEHINLMMILRKGNGPYEYPPGVIKRKDMVKYNMNVRVNGYYVRASYDTIEGAFSAYKQLKEQEIKRVANHYIKWLPSNIYDALCSYTIEITD